MPISSSSLTTWAVACSLFINGSRVLVESVFVDFPLDPESSTEFQFNLMFIKFGEFVVDAITHPLASQVK